MLPPSYGGGEGSGPVLFPGQVGEGVVDRRHEIEALSAAAQHGGHARRVMASYERWLGDGPELAVLRLLGLFDRPADAGSIAALRAAPAIPGLTEHICTGQYGERRRPEPPADSALPDGGSLTLASTERRVDRSETCSMQQEACVTRSPTRARAQKKRTDDGPSDVHARILHRASDRGQLRHVGAQGLTPSFRQRTSTRRSIHDGDFVQRELVPTEVRGQRHIVFRTLGDADGGIRQLRHVIDVDALGDEKSLTVVEGDRAEQHVQPFAPHLEHFRRRCRSATGYCQPR